MRPNLLADFAASSVCASTQHVTDIGINELDEYFDLNGFDDDLMNDFDYLKKICERIRKNRGKHVKAENRQEFKPPKDPFCKKVDGKWVATEKSIEFKNFMRNNYRSRH